MKTFLFTGLFSLLATFGYAEKFCMYAVNSSNETQQERQEFRQRIQSQRVAFFTQRLELTPAEAEKFWPLYNTFQNERERLMNEFRQKTHIRKDTASAVEFNVSKLSDADARQLVANEARRIDLERNFHNELTKLFSPQRVLVFYDTERSFQRELVQIRQRREIERQRTETQHQRETQQRRRDAQRLRTTEQ
jgi:hypothetical protein